MLKRFEVENYKNFKEKICIDFDKVGKYQFNNECISNSLISKMIIFGRNSTGKTNLGDAIADINTVLFSNINNLHDGYILNADSNKTFASFNYVFMFDNDEIQYEYRKNAHNDLTYEKMTINNKMYFECQYQKKALEFSKQLIKSSKQALVKYQNFIVNNLNYDKESVGLSFFRFLLNNTVVENNSLLRKIENYVLNMAILKNHDFIETSKTEIRHFYELLEKKDELIQFEKFLRIMGVECNITLERLPNNEKELYFKYNNQLIPFFSNASSGTLSLTYIYFHFALYHLKKTFIFLDEFDAFFHYEMAEKLVKYLQIEYRNTQIIFTSHNTNLLTNKLLRPDCLFILSRNGQLTALCDATQRELREGHNLEKMYISGEFEKYE